MAVSVAKPLETKPLETERYSILLNAYNEDVIFKESGKESIYNTETGNLKGFSYQLSYQFEHWKMSLVGEQSHGSLQYDGKTQLGRALSTNTDVVNFSHGILLDKELWQTASLACYLCSSLTGRLGFKYQDINRDILPQQSVSGLKEQYQFPFVELGLIWKANKLFFVNWQLTLSHSQAINAQLDVDFLSSYDNTKISLNNVYVNQAELLLTYPMSDNINLGILFNYSKSLIEKSDTFPITIDHITRGSFYQPQRAMYSKRVGIQLNLYF